MILPDFIRALPRLELPLPDDQVTANAVRSDQGLVVFFTFHKDTNLPPHAHKAQWGSVLSGTIELTIDGKSRTCSPGETYTIPSGAVHSVRIPAGTVVMDVFEEPDRYPLKV
jgi:quercetin dioxygenase-like cupin family protein